MEGVDLYGGDYHRRTRGSYGPGVEDADGKRQLSG